MNLESKNPFGGSAGGGGFDYQAEAWALVAAKILAQESFNWVESGCDQVPISIRMETGSGGDDLQITLQSGARIELQAKRGLRREDRLWDALLPLARAVEADANTYGVLLTTTANTSNTVRTNLAEGIIRVGEGITDDFPDIVQDFLNRLQEAGINAQSVCSRIRIIVRDLKPSSSGEEETFAALRKVLSEPSQIRVARSTLVSDGHDQIKLRGGRDTNSLIRILKQAGISLSNVTENQLILRQAFIDWSIKINAMISIPSLNVELPMSKAWVHLRAMAPLETPDAPKSLAEQIQDYHEWHRLADTRQTSTIDVESAANRERLLVIVGGPGSGKSTLLRRLAQSWSARDRVVLRVSLRAMALRMSKGETFDEALLAMAAEGFQSGNEALHNLLASASFLLADGLDETDPNRANIADKLQRWASANAERRVVLTTRPVGHNPAWFEEWEHFELLPLGQSDVSDFAKTIFGLLHPTDSKEAEKKSNSFLEELTRSRTASIAARNPQLLGFLIALYANGYDIGGNRYQLFDNVIEEIRKQTIPDRVFQQGMDAPIAHRMLDCTGWLMLHNPSLPEGDLIQSLGQQAATELSLQPLPAQRIASNALLFWKERGLLEQLSAGVETTYTFVHEAFQEFTATRFLEQISEQEFTEWIRSQYNAPRLRETLLFTGATKRLAVAINTLLELDDPSDPVCTVALLAADVLAEAETSPAELRELVFQHLAPRLTSNVPMVVYEAAKKLRPLAIVSPTTIGPMALKLAKYEQQWTKEVACTLGLLSGDEYVDVEELLAVFPTAFDTRTSPGRRRGFIGTAPLLANDLVIKGAEYLLKDDAPIHHLEVVKAKYNKGNGYSWRTHGYLYNLLVKHLPPEEAIAIRPKWYSTSVIESTELWNQAAQEADIVVMEATLVASEGLVNGEIHCTTDPKMNSLVQLMQALKISETPATDVYDLRRQHLQEAIAEVIRGAILVAALNPAQVRADAKHALHKLSQSQDPFYWLTGDTEKTKSEPQLDWTLAQNQRLRPDLLCQAMRHPAWFICNFAALLLMNCIEKDAAGADLQEVLASDSEYALYILSQVASEVWQDQAANLVLDRLEQSLTSACAPLVEALDDICDESNKQRAKATLQRAFESKDADLVQAALHTTEKLDLDDSLAVVIENCYRWWLLEGPQYPEEAGIIPENVAPSLLSHLATNQRISFEEIHEAANAKRPDIRSVAIEEIGRFLEEQDALVEPVINDINRGRLPSGIIDELSKSYPTVCKRHFESFVGFLDSDNQQIQIACIRALGDGWAGYDEAEGRLRALLDAPSTRIRDEVVSTLRHLNTVYLG